MTREIDPEVAADALRRERPDRDGHDDSGFDSLVAKAARDAAETIRSGGGSSTCERCKHVVKPYYRHCPRCEGWRNLLQVERLEDAIRKVKASPPKPDQQAAFIKRLIELGHPDAVGLIKSVTEQKAGKKAKGAL